MTNSILVYIEPRTDLDFPVSRTPWVDFALDFIKTLGISITDDTDNYRIVCNYWIHKYALSIGIPERNCLVVEEQDLLESFDGNHGHHRRATFLEDSEDNDLHHTVGMKLLNLTKDFTPEIILTFVPEPALKHSFPEAMILHHEIGCFSRAPYPQTFRLDPCGLIANSWPYEVRKSLRELPTNSKSTEFLDNLRDYFLQTLIEPYTPFKEQINHFRENFDKLWLLPLGPPLFNYHYPVPDCPVNFMSQFDMIQWLMHRIPPNQGIIIIEHPVMPFLTDEHINHLKERYSNACFMPESGEIASASQYIVPYIDGVITINSSIGYQAAFYGKELVTLGGRTFLAPLADGSDISYIINNQTPMDSGLKDAILHHLLTHYFVPTSIFQDKEYISKFIQHSLTNYKNNRHSLSFFNRIAEDDVIIRLLKETATASEPLAFAPHSRKIPLSQFAVLRKHYHPYPKPQE